MQASQGCNKQDELLVFINFLLPGHLWLGVTVKGAPQADVQTPCQALLQYIKYLFKKDVNFVLMSTREAFFSASVQHLVFHKETNCIQLYS